MPQFGGRITAPELSDAFAVALTDLGVGAGDRAEAADVSRRLRLLVCLNSPW
jgi:hypothetical protein